ncbi:MAG: hypothetical protein ABI647_22245 [Gemmatimonadota bacterium]
MTHLSVEQLVALREPGLEPHVQGWREHVERCPLCRAELERLEQRVARLKALPTLRPGRDQFFAIQGKARAEQRRKRLRRTVWVSVALAASLAVVVQVRSVARYNRTLVAVGPGSNQPELAEIMERSKQLEGAISSFDPDQQVVDGRAIGITTSLEERLARVDNQLQMVHLMDPILRDQQALRLWRERVGLLDALMDVHMTGAHYVGF